MEGGGGFARGLAGWCSGPCLVAGSPRVLEENNVKDTGLNRSECDLDGESDNSDEKYLCPKCP